MHQLAPDNSILQCLAILLSRRNEMCEGAQRYGLLQMFARELTAGWTSWGNEVLRFQQMKHFEPG